MRWSTCPPPPNAITHSLFHPSSRSFAPTGAIEHVDIKLQGILLMYDHLRSLLKYSVGCRPAFYTNTHTHSHHPKSLDLSSSNTCADTAEDIWRRMQTVLTHALSHSFDKKRNPDSHCGLVGRTQRGYCFTPDRTLQTALIKSLEIS